MDNGKNFDGYLAAMAQVSSREREKLLDKARNDKGVTVAGYLKLENYVMSMAGKEREEWKRSRKSRSRRNYPGG